MNKLTLSLMLLMSYGCSQPLFNSRSAIAPVNSSPGCPEKPTLNLDQQTVEDINLDQSLVKSGRVTATEAVGYQFDAQSGQTLTYSTNEDVCIVVYTPDNQIIDGGELPTSGKYIVQVSSPQDERAFDLKMSLTTPVVENIPETPTPEPTTVNTASSSPTTNQTTVKNTPRTKTRRPRPVKTASSSPTTNQTTVNDTPTTDQTTVNDTPTTDQTTVNDTPTTDQTTVNDTPTTETQKPIPIAVPSNPALVSQSVSSPEPSISRPPADDFVRNHYTALNNRQYDQTWSNLSSRFKSISKDFSNYQEWWDSVAEIRIGNVELISQNSDRAVVDAQLWYEMNNGRVAEDKKTRISLMWSDEANSWLFVSKSSP